METTVRCHMHDKVARKHNKRDPDLVEHEPHIDAEKGVHEIWGEDRDLVQAYQDIFGDALDQYNAGQKRKDRRMSMGEYMESVENDTRGRRRRKIQGGKKVPDMEAKKGKKLSYELVVSVGNTEKARDEKGRVMYDDQGHEVHPQAVPPEVNYAVCREYVRTFEARNPHLKMARCDWHNDEWYKNKNGVQEWGTAHAHIEFIPYATGYKRGLSAQASIGKALAQQGFSDHMEGDRWICAYEAWQDRERVELEALTRKHYAEYCKTHPDYMAEYGDDLDFLHPYEDRMAESVGPSAYRAEVEADMILADAEYEAATIRDGLAEDMERVNRKRKGVERREQAVGMREQALDAKAADLEVKEQALQEVQEVVQQGSIKLLKDRKRFQEQLDERKKALDDREKDLLARERVIEARERAEDLREARNTEAIRRGRVVASKGVSGGVQRQRELPDISGIEVNF